MSHVPFLLRSLFLALSVFVLWRVVATRVSDALAREDPQRALQWDHHNPQARLALAESQLPAAPLKAAETAREVLAASPLQAEAFGLIARAMAATGDLASARALFSIATRRAPRDTLARAWLIDDQMQQGNFPAALRNIDVLYRISPSLRPTLLSLLSGKAAQDPNFAQQLGQFVADMPIWRDALFSELLARADIETVVRIFETVSATTSGLTTTEAGRWYDRLMKDRQWGAAYSRWVSRLHRAGVESIPALYNGDFEKPISSIGFDWRSHPQVGVQIEQVADGADTVVELVFRGRRVDNVGLSQTLLLAPGSYRFSFRTQVQALRSNQGLQWDLRCAGTGQKIVSTARLNGDLDWKRVTTDFTIPSDACPAQILSLTNPGAGGAAKVVTGTIRFDELQIAPQPQDSGAG
ncbi:MAG TPA: hypothetical protein VFN29_07125 [Chiayiivirga sp.]|nr:hypothetical protein [Chiayiivirga sp.]